MVNFGALGTLRHAYRTLIKPSTSARPRPGTNEQICNDVHVVMSLATDYETKRRRGVRYGTFGYCPTRQGDVVFQVVSSFVAQSVDLSVWQDVQGLGILYLSVIAGEMNLKVCELTKAPGTPWVSIFGMWQATH
jgi:hypothetical protein